MIAVGISFLLAVLVIMAVNRERARIRPAVVFTQTFELPDVSFYELAASRIRPETLHEIEESA